MHNKQHNIFLAQGSKL